MAASLCVGAWILSSRVRKWRKIVSVSDTVSKGGNNIHTLVSSLLKTAMIGSNGHRGEDSSETVPILSECHIVEESQEDTPPCEDTLCEIRTIDQDDLVVNEPTFDDESCSLVNQEQPQCRICLDDIEGKDLIAPCHCKGTQKYVHRSCLDNWRSTKEGFAFAHCTECRARFLLRANVPADRWRLRLKFQLLVARDHAFIFIVVQLIVAMLGVLIYKFYGEELREMFGYEEHQYGFYTMAVLAIILLGLLYGFFIAIICGQRINERHHHILAKQELTKEYIVEDRECKDVPELDTNHISELQMLGLY